MSHERRTVPLWEGWYGMNGEDVFGGGGRKVSCCFSEVERGALYISRVRVGYFYNKGLCSNNKKRGYRLNVEQL